MNASRKTTAQILGRLRKELLSEGVPPDLADDLVRDAGHTLVEVDGVEVNDA